MKRIIAFLILTTIGVACSPDSNQSGEQVMPRFVIDAIEPDYGIPGTEVVIRGNNFDISNISVVFDQVQVPILSATALEIRVIAPEHKPGDVPVVISSATQSITKYFYFLSSPPQDTEISYPQTEVGKILKSEKSPKIIDVLWDTTYNVTTDVDYYQMKITTDAAENQNIYLIKAVPSKTLGIHVAVPSTTTSTVWKKQTLTQMYNNINTSDNPVYVMINGDFWNTTEPIHPRGPVHSKGKILSTLWDYDSKQSQQGLSFVGIRNDGSMIIAPRSKYEEEKGNLAECTGAGFMFISDGKFSGSNYIARDPRTAIGHTEDNVIWTLTVDGRHGTTGMTYAEMASIFQGLGCVSAVNLDGGGSAQLLVRNPQTEKRTICNWPSDPTEGKGGQERPVINGWAIVKK